MKIERQLSAAQLATGVILGGIVSAGGFLVLIPQHSSMQSRGERIFVSLAFFVVGLVISLWAGSDLTNGMQGGRWPDEKIETMRAHLESPWLRGLAVAFLVLACLLLAFSAHDQGRGLFWPALILSQTITRLQLSAKRPLATPEPINWHNASPIYSEHWGER